MSDGITVLPDRSTRTAPWGAWRSPFLPIQVHVSPSTRNAEFSMGPLPSPGMSRAPSNQNAPLFPRWTLAAETHANETIREHQSIRDRDMRFLCGMAVHGSTVRTDANGRQLNTEPASSRVRTAAGTSLHPLAFCPAHKGEKSPLPSLSALARNGMTADAA